MKTVTKLLLAAVIAVPPAFLWGFHVHRDGIFPYRLLRRVGLRLRTGARVELETGVDERDLLAGLPYVGGTHDPNSGSRGVLIHDRERSFAGLNLYGSRALPAAELVDMRGHVVREWSYPSGAWMHVHLLGDGGLLVSVEDRRMIRLDAESDLVWSTDARFHHDFHVQPDGSVFALTRRASLLPRVHAETHTLEDTITVVSTDGEIEEEFSVVDVFRDTPYEFLLPNIGHRTFHQDDVVDADLELDILHTNHIEVFDGRLAERSPLYRKGNLLISCRNINTILIVDGRTRKAIWAWGTGTLRAQHHPTLCDNGNFLVFNNGAERSEVLEIDPLSGRVVWSWAPGKTFSSRVRGSNQRLPNGNTLITDSDKGYVHEVTPSGEVVWSFANPDVYEGGMRGAIWRMTRIQPADYPFLDRSR